MSHRSPPTFSPYDVAAANDIYDLLFCDRPDAFRARPGEAPTRWQGLLSAEPPDVPGLTELARDAALDGRIRYLAFGRLREAGAPVPPKVLLGVIVEVGLIGGLDTLAAYADGGVRYINHSGKMVMVEGVAALRPLVDRLLDAARPVAGRIGPWDQPRKPPPDRGNMRLTFLTSDGLYLGEGPGQLLQEDELAGPVVRAATQLLVKVIQQGKAGEG